jgi:hypothetical protein
MRIMRSEYLQYWWVSRSKINPKEYSGVYYRVFYDFWRRHVVVERYDTEHNLDGRYEFVWKRGKLARTLSYLPNGELQHYTVYQRNWLGCLLRMERYLPDGTMSLIEAE